MGCCFGKDEEHVDRLVPTERDPLINPGSEGRITSDYSGLQNETVGGTGQRDEQSALSRIVDQTANNVISVAPSNVQGIEQREYKERSRAYNQRLSQTVAVGGRRRPQHMSHAQPAHVLLAVQPISAADLHLINKTAEASVSAITDIRVTHQEDLVVILGMK